MLKKKISLDLQNNETRQHINEAYADHKTSYQNTNRISGRYVEDFEEDDIDYF